jgi:hypothetical protein
MIKNKYHWINYKIYFHIILRASPTVPYFVFPKHVVFELLKRYQEE